MDLAIDSGVNYFDVAPYYGLGVAEETLGAALPQDTSNIVISTKVGRYGRDHFDFSSKKIHQSIQLSLKRLKRDYLDIVFCHDIEFVAMDDVLEAVAVLIDLKSKGLIRAIGISGFPLDYLYHVSCQADIDGILTYCHYTLLNQDLDRYIQRFCDLKLGIINASPFAMGLLTQNQCPAWHPETAKNKAAIADIICHHMNDISIEQLAFQFAYSCDGVSSTLTGVMNHVQLRDCLNWAQQIDLGYDYQWIIELFSAREKK